MPPAALAALLACYAEAHTAWETKGARECKAVSPNMCYVCLQNLFLNVEI